MKTIVSGKKGPDPAEKEGTISGILDEGLDENRVSKPYPACPRLPNVSIIYNNIMNYDYNISDM